MAERTKGERGKAAIKRAIRVAVDEELAKWTDEFVRGFDAHALANAVAQILKNNFRRSTLGGF